MATKKTTDIAVKAPETALELKSTKLINAANRVNKLLVNTNQNAVQIAIELGTVSKKETYKEDNFKSLKDYAAIAVNGMSPDTAWKFARVGSRFFVEPTDTAAAVVDYCGKSIDNLSYLMSLTDDQLSVMLERFKEADIKPTQDAIRKAASEIRDEARAAEEAENGTEVLPRFAYFLDMSKKSVFTGSEPDFTEWVKDGKDTINVYPVKGSFKVTVNDVDHTFRRVIVEDANGDLFYSGRVFYYTAYKAPKSKDGGRSVKHDSIEDYIAAHPELGPEAIAALKAFSGQ